MREPKSSGATRGLLAIMATLTACALWPAAAGAIAFNHTFDADNQGWRTIGADTCTNPTPQPSTHQLVNGNPNGNILAGDNGDGNCLFAFLPPLVANQNRVANYGGTLTFQINTGATAATINPVVQLTDAQGNSLAVDDPSPPATNTWTSVSFLINETSPDVWGYTPDGGDTPVAATQANFFEVLQDLNNIAIIGDLSPDTLTGTTRLDNASLTDGPVADTDGDGVTNVADNCPLVPGPASNNGCPIPPDQDGDTVPDATDQCPTVFGPPSNNGCPLTPANPDPDGDGLIGAADKCPNETGPASNDGCPKGTNPPGGDDAACDAAKKKLDKAKAKLKKLRQNDAKPSQIAAAKKKVKKAKVKVKEACA